MKTNNRGFLLAESLVVSTFVLTVLILLYIQFSNLTTNYKNSYNYNNVESIYDLASVADYLKTNNYPLASQLTEDKPYVVVFKDNSCNIDAGIIDSFCDDLINKMDAKTIIYTSSDINTIQKYVSTKEDNTINEKLREFISKVETNTVLNKGRLFAEFNNGTFATIAMDTNTDVKTTLLCNADNVVTNGDGLYMDEYEPGRCFYKGADPNNYIEFNGETWRVLSVESDGSLKLIKNGTLESPNTWSTIVEPWTASQYTWSQTSLMTYLNDNYLKTMTVQDKIIDHSWDVGNAATGNNDLTSQIKSEKKSTWIGKVGLITASEYLRTNTNKDQCATYQLNNSNSGVCHLTNWINSILPTSGGTWTLISNAQNNEHALAIFAGGGTLDTNRKLNTSSVLPSVYIAPNTSLTGTGTPDNPYKIQ